MATLQSSPGFFDAVAQVRKADSTDHFETQAGIQVTGVDVSWAYALGGQAKAEFLPRKKKGPVLIRLNGKCMFDFLGEPVSRAPPVRRRDRNRACRTSGLHRGGDRVWRACR